MSRIAALFAAVLATIGWLGFSLLSLLAIPLSVVTIMRWTDWEWWWALIAAFLLPAVPVVGWLVGALTTVMGAWYLIAADFDLGAATGSAMLPTPLTFAGG